MEGMEVPYRTTEIPSIEDAKAGHPSCMGLQRGVRAVRQKFVRIQSLHVRTIAFKRIKTGSRETSQSDSITKSSLGLLHHHCM